MIRRGWRRSAVEFRFGRVGGELDPANLSRPWLMYDVGYPDENAWVAVGYGLPGTDPVVHVEFDLTGTRLARWWSVVRWGRRREQEEPS